MKKKILLASVLLILCGCATEPIPYDYYRFNDIIGDYTYNDYKIEITSEPSGARIEWNGDYIGVTPLEYVVKGLPKPKAGDLYGVIIKAELVAPIKSTKIKTLTTLQPLPRSIHFDMNAVERVTPEIVPSSSKSKDSKLHF